MLKLFQIILLFAVLLSLPVFCPAQPDQQIPETTEHVRYMVLDKGWPVHRIRFYPGQNLMFKLKGERGWNYGRIQMVHKNAVTVMDATIPFSEIRKISIRRNNYRNNFANLTAGSLIGGGALWMVMGGINTIDNRNGEGAVLSYAGAGAVVLGLGLRTLTKRTFRISGNKRLRSI